MNQNDKNNKNSNQNKGGGNWRGVMSLICWALLATIIISYASSYFGSAGHQGSSMTVEYSTFKDMVAQDQVEMVQFDNSENILHIVLQDG